MLARYIRLMLLCELAAYVAIVEWLHFLYGWDRGMLALAALVVALASRVLIVCITTALGVRLGTPPAPEHRIGFGGYLALIGRESAMVLANNFFRFPFPEWALRPDPAPQPSRRMPIVLVHGYFSNRGLWRLMVPRLEARGFAPVFTPTLTAAFANIERFADELAAEIERIASGTAQSKVVLVCHSMGGLAARLYLCKRGASRVAKVITFASPHNGTVHALLGAGENARQMERGSAFLKELCEKEGERRPECGVTSIYTPQDNLVAPQETSRLAWAKNVALPGYGHLDLLASDALFEVLVKELDDCYSSARTSSA